MSRSWHNSLDWIARAVQLFHFECDSRMHLETGWKPLCDLHISCDEVDASVALSQGRQRNERLRKLEHGVIIVSRGNTVLAAHRLPAMMLNRSVSSDKMGARLQPWRIPCKTVQDVNGPRPQETPTKYTTVQCGFKEE